METGEVRKVMADTKKNILTYAGLKKYEEELADLKLNRRKEVAQKIKEAREQGDLSENAEYDAAKDEQRDIELRIEELEKLLKNAEVVVEDEIELDKINAVSYTHLDVYKRQGCDPDPDPAGGTRRGSDHDHAADRHRQKNHAERADAHSGGI